MTKPTPPPNTVPGPRIEPVRFQPPSNRAALPALNVSWLRALTLLALVVVLITAWFVLTARSVGIRVEPADATVDVRSWPAPRIGNHWLLLKGTRRVRVAAPGYVTFDGEVTIGPAQLQSLNIVLDKLPGLLRVRVAPVAAARLLVDGREHGDVPGLVAGVPAGRHEISVAAPRYLPFTTTLEIEGKAIEQPLEVTLEPAWAEVTVDSRPQGATVVVDREILGRTPLTTELLHGRRLIELKLERFKPWQQTLAVEPSTPVNLGEIVLAKADGRLKLTTEPGDANVTVDGEYRGRSPLLITLTPDAAHTLKVIKEGYATVERKVQLESGQRDSLTLDLPPELATIHLETVPPEAELLLDGEPRGSATQTLSLPTFEHELVIRAPGYATYQTQVTPRKGVAKRYRIRLKTSAEMAREGAAGAAPTAARPGAPAAGTVTSRDGQEMKLFTGGEVLLGAPSRDPARRANEAQRPVSLKRPFYLARKEVTNGEFRMFLGNHSSGASSGIDLNGDLLPVTGVTWEIAATYCNWLSRRDGLPPFYQIRFGEVLGVNPAATGYRLPTEAEWEWAAKVPPKGQALPFPWGANYPPRGRSGNYADRNAVGAATNPIKEYDDGFAAAAPVGSFPPNLRGLYDMDGNVAEWVHDFYEGQPATAAAVDPLGPPTGNDGHVVKGASWALGGTTPLRLSYRDAGTNASETIGFRLARYAQ